MWGGAVAVAEDRRVAADTVREGDAVRDLPPRPAQAWVPALRSVRAWAWASAPASPWAHPSARGSPSAPAAPVRRRRREARRAARISEEEKYVFSWRVSFLPRSARGGFGSIIGRFEAKRQGTSFQRLLVQRELLSEAKLRDCSLQKATILRLLPAAKSTSLYTREALKQESPEA